LGIGRKRSKVQKEEKKEEKKTAHERYSNKLSPVKFEVLTEMK